MCDFVRCHVEGTTFLQFHGGRTQLCFLNARVPVGKMFDSQSVRVAQTPCELIPFESKKILSMDFTLDLLIRAFFGRGELEVCHSELCLLVVGSYSKTQVSSLVITHCRKLGSLVTRSKSSEKPTHAILFVQETNSSGPVSHKFSSCADLP